MSIKSNIISEFRNEPVQTTSALIATFISIGGLLLAWILSESSSDTVSFKNDAHGSATVISIRNLLVVLSSSMAVIFSGAYTIRILGRKYPFHALVLSVAVASFVSFLAVLVFCMLPPQQTTTLSVIAAKNAAFYGTVVVFIAINGLPILKEVASSVMADEKNGSSGNNRAEGDGIGAVGLILLLLIGWGTFVAYGQSILVDTFIRDRGLTHGLDQKKAL